MFEIDVKNEDYKISSDLKEDIRFQLHEVASRILLDPRFDNKKEKNSRRIAELLLTDPDATQSQIKKAQKSLYPRVTKCHKIPLWRGNSVDDVQGVQLQKHKEHGSFKFGGLLHCGSAWSCPICASNISRTRCEEITQAFECWQNLGESKGEEYSMVMVSFTIPHHVEQSIDKLRKSFMTTRTIMSGQQILRRNPTFLPWNGIKEKYGIQGKIAAIECTYGYNGWHPHSHDILFLNRTLTDDELYELKSYLTTAWIYACRRTKVEMDLNQETHMYSKSVHVSRATTAQQYISKFGVSEFEKHKEILNPGWGPAQELTKSHIKKSRGDNGYTPWDFLRLIHQFPEDKSIYLKFGRLFRDYSRSFHGKQQIFFSKDFKKNLIDTLYIIGP